MSEPRQVTGFILSNGAFVEDPDLARLKQSVLDFRKALNVAGITDHSEQNYIMRHVLQCDEAVKSYLAAHAAMPEEGQSDEPNQDNAGNLPELGDPADNAQAEDQDALD